MTTPSLWQATGEVKTTGPKTQIILAIKKSRGLTVQELSEFLEMSYMGVKQQCEKLVQEGFLQVFRERKTVGRPEHRYRLTEKAHALFPSASNELSLSLLESAQQLYGPTAPGKLLLLYFQSLNLQLSNEIRGDSLLEKARWLAQRRDQAGCLCRLEKEPELHLVEYHHPLRDIFTAYPLALHLEREMLEKLLGVRIRRQQDERPGIYENRFFFLNS